MVMDVIAFNTQGNTTIKVCKHNTIDCATACALYETKKWGLKGLLFYWRARHHSELLILNLVSFTVSPVNFLTLRPIVMAAHMGIKNSHDFSHCLIFLRALSAQ